MYQRLTVPPQGLENVYEPWYHAIQRCLDSCNDITAAVRLVDDSDLETTNPLLTFCIFVAARFLIRKTKIKHLTAIPPLLTFVKKVHAKHFNLETPRNLDLLLYALKTSGQRWPISRKKSLQPPQLLLMHTIRPPRKGHPHRPGRVQDPALHQLAAGPVLRHAVLGARH